MSPLLLLNASKNNMSLPDNNLRRLSAAHARGLIDTRAYRRMRTEQLSAMEFNRKAPNLPLEMMDLTIPKQKIDAPHQPKVTKSSKKGLIVTFIVIVLLAAGAAYYYLNYIA